MGMPLSGRRQLLTKKLIAIVGIFLVVVATCDTSSPSQTTFAGKVTRGQSFEKEIGHELLFRLIYFEGDGQGWEIWVGDRTQPEQNFSAYVTPPYRGLNARYIWGIDFSRPELGNVRTRPFYFVLDESTHQLAAETLHKMMWPYEFSEAEVERAWEIHTSLPKVSAILTITDMEFGDQPSYGPPEINSLEFTVNINGLAVRK